MSLYCFRLRQFSVFLLHITFQFKFYVLLADSSYHEHSQEYHSSFLILTQRIIDVRFQEFY